MDRLMDLITPEIDSAVRVGLLKSSRAYSHPG